MLTAKVAWAAKVNYFFFSIQSIRDCCVGVGVVVVVAAAVAVAVADADAVAVAVVVAVVVVVVVVVVQDYYYYYFHYYYFVCIYYIYVYIIFFSHIIPHWEWRSPFWLDPSCWRPVRSPGHLRVCLNIWLYHLVMTNIAMENHPF